MVKMMPKDRAIGCDTMFQRLAPAEMKKLRVPGAKLLVIPVEHVKTRTNGDNLGIA